MDEPRHLLDASALLALFFDESGADRVAEVLETAAISAVNLSEVVAKSLDRKMSEKTVGLNLADADLMVLPFDERTAMRTGALRPLTRRHGLSLADRACLATAQLTGRVTLTADRAWQGLEIGVQVEVIR